MVTVEVKYPGRNFYYTCDREAAAWLMAQFKDNEWIDCRILEPGESAK